MNSLAKLTRRPQFITCGHTTSSRKTPPRPPLFFAGVMEVGKRARQLRRVCSTTLRHEGIYRVGKCPIGTCKWEPMDGMGGMAARLRAASARIRETVVLLLLLLPC